MKNIFFIVVNFFVINIFSQVSCDTVLKDHPLVPRQVDSKLIYKEVFRDSNYNFIFSLAEGNKEGKQIEIPQQRLIKGDITRLTYVIKKNFVGIRNFYIYNKYRSFLEESGFKRHSDYGLGSIFYRYKVYSNHPHSDLIERVDSSDVFKSDVSIFYKTNPNDSVFVIIAYSMIPRDSNYLFIDVIEKNITHPLTENSIDNALSKDGRINIYGILFNSGSYEITKESMDNVEILANFLKNTPDAEILILGHTDNTGTPEYNQILSRLRAEAIKQSLINEFKIHSERMKTKGFGDSQPIRDNNTEEGRYFNRRVEIVKL